MMLIRCSAALLLATLAAGAQTAKPPVWEMESSGTTAGLRGVHAVGGGVVWASGEHGTVLRTEDSGYMWQSCAMPPGAEKLDFRGIWAWDANTAVVMSSGPGDLSRLYKTTDGCSHWTLVFTNPDKDGFWDALQFNLKPQDGFVLGDPVRDRFVLLHYDPKDKSWSQDVGLEKLKPLAGESIFAASNSSFDADEINGFYFATGGPSGAWLITEVEGPSAQPVWHRFRVPVGEASASSGIFSVQMRSDETEDRDSPDRKVGVAVGGDYMKPLEPSGTAAWTKDRGVTWLASTTPPGGYRSAVAWDPADNTWITVGPNGSDYSTDNGKTWQPLEHSASSKPGEWNALSLPWVVGPNGRIAKLNSDALPPQARAATRKSSK